jgi:Acetyltransferase (GNAT) domain
MHEAQLYYKQRPEIDISRWNQCIDNAPNGLIYAYSFYLDNTADNWNALILNDYEAVMPLPWKKKFGFYYLYQPFFIAQLGLFGKNLTADILESFLKAIPAKFRLWEFSFNHQNLFRLKDFSLFERMNFVLPLNQSYELLYANYRENIRRNIKKSIQYGCYVKTDVDIDCIIQLAKQQPSAAPENEFRRFKKVFQLLKEKSMAKAYAVFSNKDDLLASCVFTFSHNRAYYILVGNHPNGRTLGASHSLIDAFIKDHAGKELLLDFEGSDIRGLALFYSSFGACEEKYSAIKLNKLPWYIKWMKD